MLALSYRKYLGGGVIFLFNNYYFVELDYYLVFGEFPRILDTVCYDKQF